MGDKKRRIFVVGIAVFIALGTLLSAYVADFRARRSAQERAETVLLDSAREQAKTLASTLNGRFQVLKSISASLALDESHSEEDIEQLLHTVQSSAALSFSTIDLIYADGTMADGGADGVSFSDRPYFQSALAGKPGMERIVDRQSGWSGIVLTVPYYRDGEIAGVLRGLYYERDLRELLISEAYGGSGYSYLINSRGDVIVDTESHFDLLSNNNLLDILSQASFHHGHSLEELRDNLAAGKRYTLYYETDGESRVAALYPVESELLPQNDWYVFNVIRESLLAGETAMSRRDTLESVTIIAVFSVVALGLLLVLENDYRRRAQKERESSRQREEQFRIVTEQSGKSVMRYSIPEKTVWLNDTVSDGFGGRAIYTDAAEEIIRQGFIDDASAEDYRAFFKRIDAGESPVSAQILMVRPGGARRWYKHDAVTIFDKNGRPESAVIAYFDNTDQRERELAYAKWKQELDSISNEATALYEWNLTRDVGEAQRGQLAVDYSGLPAETFNARTVYFAQRYVAEEDRAAFAAMMNREHLITLYFSRVYRSSLDYRFITDEGDARWRQISVQLVPYPDNQDIKVYVTNRDIDREKREEMALVARSEQDYLTGALNRETFIRRVEELIARSPVASHALLMLDVDGFKQVNDRLGHDVGDRVLSDFVSYIRSVLRAGDMVGRIGGDEFMVCLPDMPFDAAVSKKAAQLCAALRRRLSDQLMISASIGVAMYPRDGSDFETLYRCVDAALYYAKNRGKDSYAFYRAGMSVEKDAALPDANEADGVESASRRAVLVATDSDEAFSEFSTLLSPEYEALRLTDRNELPAFFNRGHMVYAVLLDVDTAVGRSLLNTTGRRLIDLGLTLFGVSVAADEASSIPLVEAGVALVLSRPVNRDYLLLRLERLYAIRSKEKTRLQSAYQRLQTSEEMRYREVLGATGTTVFVYDISTRTYQVDLLANTATGGVFIGHSLGDEMEAQGLAERADIDKVREAMGRVETGETPSASHTMKLTTRDGGKRWFRIQIMKMENADVLTPKLLMTVNDVNEQVEADEALRFRAERDALTGLYNRETFIEKATAMIAAREAGYYVMACFDIDNFKIINDQYGTARGDEVLKRIADTFCAGFRPIGGICCRVMADNFAVLYPASFMESEEVAQIRRAALLPDGFVQPITFSIGRYLVEDSSLPVSGMFDRASIAKASVKGRFDVHIAQYDESMRDNLLRVQEIRDDMDAALETGQFEVWFQPQYNHSTGALIGAEALARWRHPRRGLIPPGEFVPVFERNGFIYELDRFVWERCCLYLRRWLDAGRAPLPLSVNVSRYDVFRDGFYETITGLVEQYGIPVSLIRLEITESAFAQSTAQIIGMVRRLIDYGFTIEIDDFGSGYSSLNTLKDVPANILKLDMRFLEGSESSRRGGSILESIVRMAMWLGMPVIAEGVETRQQADFLKSIGCNYVQGYLYARPMPVEEYERLAKSSGKEAEMIALETVETLDNEAFWDPDSMETLIFNSYVGGACIFEFSGGKTELLRVNEKYVRELGGESLSMQDVLNADFSAYLDAKNLAILHDSIRRAIDTGEESACEIRVCGELSDPVEIYVRAAVRVIARTVNRWLLYGSVANVTAQRTAEKKEREASERMQAIMDNVNSGVAAVTIEDSVVRFVFANEKYYGILGYTREQYEAEVSDTFLLIHQDDRESIKRTVAALIAAGGSDVYDYRCIRRDGEIIDLRCNASVKSITGIGERALLAVITDMTAFTRAERRIRETDEQLRFLNDTARDLLAQPEGDEGIRRVLQKTLGYFGGSRAYIYEYLYEEDVCSNTYEVCAPGVPPFQHAYTRFPLKTAWFWLKSFETSDFLYIADADKLDDARAAEHDVLHTLGVRSALAVSLRADGKVVGTMGVFNPTRHLSDLDNLGAIGDYMAVILARRDLTKRIRGDNDRLLQLMNDTPGGFVRLRVLADGTARVQYLNDGFCRLVGMSHSEAMERYGKDRLWGLHPDDRDTARRFAEEMLRTGKRCSVQYRRLCGDGNYVRFLVSGRMTKNESGETFLNVYYMDMPAE